MADDLADLGEPVTDRTLVLNVIRGLNENFTDIGRHLRRGRLLRVRGHIRPLRGVRAQIRARDQRQDAGADRVAVWWRRRRGPGRPGAQRRGTFGAQAQGMSLQLLATNGEVFRSFSSALQVLAVS